MQLIESEFHPDAQNVTIIFRNELLLHERNRATVEKISRSQNPVPKSWGGNTVFKNAHPRLHRMQNIQR